MHFALISKILGLLLMLFSFTMLIPAGVAFWYQDGSMTPFISSFAITFLCGLALWLPFLRARAELQPRDGFLVVTLYWTVLGMIGGLPFMLSPELNLSFTDAIFESISGFTTTGSTVLSGLDYLPRSLLFWRALSNWLGGMGVIVLALAILPMLGIGGMQLYKAEIPGPSKDAKLTPRIAETAKALWYIYVSLTAACAVAFHFAGMSWFDAICHSFSALATGGFSTHDASIGYFDSGLINIIAAGFIFLGALNFSLFFVAWKDRSLSSFMRDPEFRFFLGLEIVYIAVVTLALIAHGTYDDSRTALHHAILQVLSLSTGTGFVSASIGTWPTFVPFLLILSSFIGGCAGSTAGGMKVVRAALVFHHSQRELRRLIYPSGIFVLRFGARSVNDKVLQAVWGFVGVYITISVLSVIAVTASGVDFTTAMSAVAASINNMGAGIAGISGNFGDLPTVTKWVLCVDMLLGRLEVFTILVLFMPMFWRQ
ncbi:TrkH family potassium uptake protein [Alloalcanivorax mobilis]|uniref:TrkH family potassium uptake protein n=1 Tax=Alloalcanivorax mobilis TaxID=2019569 RepID=UPI000B5B28EB|nr:TrkH family potassium uptake protein [Alloalcanivorax mobilis]ASK35912.1 potassium transporter [Alcanivorax sp. N3-2A]|tara:strand:- start:60659 stop:62110 length:1452 start_codon:yes stop_codon:yes gene_type:complete